VAAIMVEEVIMAAAVIMVEEVITPVAATIGAAMDTATIHTAGTSGTVFGTPMVWDPAGNTRTTTTNIFGFATNYSRLASPQNATGQARAAHRAFPSSGV
jgi:hypothetical protein